MCVALFLNLAVQAKKQIHKDGAAKARGDSASRDRTDTTPWFIASATMPASVQKEAMQSIGIVSYKSVITELGRTIS